MFLNQLHEVLQWLFLHISSRFFLLFFFLGFGSSFISTAVITSFTIDAIDSLGFVDWFRFGFDVFDVFDREEISLVLASSSLNPASPVPFSNGSYLEDKMKSTTSSHMNITVRFFFLWVPVHQDARPRSYLRMVVNCWINVIFVQFLLQPWF